MSTLGNFIGAKVRELLDNAPVKIDLDKPYFGPSDEHLSWDDLKQSRLIRLDDAVEILHLMAAKVAVRGVAATIRETLERGHKALEAMTVSAVSKGALRRSQALLGQLLAVLEDTTPQVKREGAIRIAAKMARRDVRAHYLRPKRGQRRKTSVVYSRHYTPPQRRANTQWRDPASRAKS